MARRSKKGGLTDQQELFCQEYIKDLNATSAAIRAGYKERSAQAQASRLLSVEKVSGRIHELMHDRSDRLRLEADEVLREILTVAKADVKDLFDSKGALLPVKEMPDGIRKAISSVEVYDDVIDGTKVRETTKIKLWNKLRALELLGKHLKLFGETTIQNNTQVNIQNNINVNADIARELDKIEDGRWEG